MTAAKKTAAKKTVTVAMRGTSYGAVDGDQREVSKETAERLVSAGLARYSE